MEVRWSLPLRSFVEHDRFVGVAWRQMSLTLILTSPARKLDQDQDKLSHATGLCCGNPVIGATGQLCAGRSADFLAGFAQTVSTGPAYDRRAAVLWNWSKSSFFVVSALETRVKDNFVSSVFVCETTRHVKRRCD